ncbi:chromodomain-helicase-DNA-binding protein 1-like isoform X1 [Anolis carolinensis]|uniref:Chromodomain-helicase-DNA-binding protein 1-like n=2 Tax=Anolis carolinensis TaxID=28377 RepID=G1KUC0_ANOCA|nr:PREDICTED: chromodomain-helicase-DNA-binding protein 1-like [Anolis carolinensis]|eukprot:XP_008102056.1 PREDICTED: chromodomain-helicase-DNA-binding protein 1-like [Anolis carolinensis]
MSLFFRAVSDKSKSREAGAGVEEAHLNRWGLTGINLHPYQLEGVNWLTHCYGTWHGCILGDEMGLGKTCQTISLLLVLSGKLNKRPFLVLCPLSVLNNWKEELNRFAPRLSFITYWGDKEERTELQQDIFSNNNFHILLTTYEICLKDASFLKRFNWACLVVDEAHRLKNEDSLLHKTLSEFSTDFCLLLTGTPIQNSLKELYALLTFIEPVIFPKDLAEKFVHYYHEVKKESKTAQELHSLLKPFLLRRVKSEVASELPKKMEIILYHGMSALQRKFYKAILTKDLDAFENETGKKARLQNVLIQLRKCVAHPYLFNGVEPEPFVIGDHLIEVSGKLNLLDNLLAFLYAGGHRVLLFSQMTNMLDILQDYMDYRGYSYERLDGSVRGEERHLAIKNFGQQPIFVFLLSTRAGGVGMNLTSADTVVFVDNDFNPQNDLQAIARAHRIGQNKPVKIIRLIGRDTIEEIIYRRAASKLQLTNTIIEGGQFALGTQKSQETDNIQLSEILKFGLDKLLSLDGSTICDVDLGNILGETREGIWVMDPVLSTTDGNEEQNLESHMYLYEGKDYSKEVTREDQKAFDQLLDLQKVLLEDVSQEGRALRNKANVLVSIEMGPSKKRQKLSPEELEARRRKVQEAAARRARIKEEQRQKKAEAEDQKKMAWWEANHYRSCCLESEESSEEEEEEEEEGGMLNVHLDYTDTNQTSIHYIMGDVTHPSAGEEDVIIVHCVDDSGRWGRGGLFTALGNRSDQPKKIYEQAGKMKDLKLGGTLLFPIDDKESRNKGQDLLALIVAQHRDCSNNLSGIKLPALEKGLKKIYLAAKKRNASVHLPRIGHSTKGFNWYGTERLIRKYLATRGIPTFLYYFPRAKVPSQVSTTSASTTQS